VEERGAVLSLTRVRSLLAGRVDEGDIEARAQELLSAAVLKRLQTSQSVVVPVEGLDPSTAATVSTRVQKVKFSGFTPNLPLY